MAVARPGRPGCHERAQFPWDGFPGDRTSKPRRDGGPGRELPSCVSSIRSQPLTCGPQPFSAACITGIVARRDSNSNSCVVAGAALRPHRATSPIEARRACRATPHQPARATPPARFHARRTFGAAQEAEQRLLAARELLDEHRLRARLGARTAAEIDRILPSWEGVLDWRAFNDAVCRAREHAVLGTVGARARRLAEREATWRVLEDYGLVRRTGGGAPLPSCEADGIT